MLFAMLIAASTLAPPEGTQFRDLSWEDALKEAGTTKKLVFVDFYADW